MKATEKVHSQLFLIFKLFIIINLTAVNEMSTYKNNRNENYNETVTLL